MSSRRRQVPKAAAAKSSGIGSAAAGSGGVTDGVDDEPAPPTLLTEDTEVDTKRIWLLAGTWMRTSSSAASGLRSARRLD